MSDIPIPIVAYRYRNVLMCPTCVTVEEAVLAGLFYRPDQLDDAARCERCGIALKVDVA